MDRDVMERLRFDVRLRRRRGWLEEGEFDAHLEELPDVGGKVAPEPSGDESGPGEQAPAAGGAPSGGGIGA